MQFAFIFFLELFFLFFLSRSLTRAISSLIHNLTRSKKAMVTFITLLFFPGTLIHELSHYFAAKLFFVRTHGIELLPKLEGDNLKLGSVAIDKTDFFRHILIGMAPFFVGMSILMGTLYYTAQNHLLDKPLFIVLIGYLLFEIGNTMFSSKKDMEGALELLFSLVLIISIIHFAGIHIPTFDIEIIATNPVFTQIFEKGSLFLLAPIAIDLVILFIVKIIHK